MRYALALIFLLCMGVAQIHAASADPALIGRIQNHYSKLGGFESQYEQTLNHRESGATETRKGTIKFQKPLLVRWEADAPNAELLVVSDSEIWDYIPDEELAYRYPASAAQDSHNILQVITGQAKLDRDFDVRASGEENELARLSLFPKEPTTQMVEATAWVEPKSGQIRRVRILDFYGNTNDVTLNSFKPVSAFDAALFKFRPPEGTEIEDLTTVENPERELFR